MSARTYAFWNSNALGEGLALLQGGVMVTTLQDNLSNSRKVLGTLPKGASEGFYETVFWSVPRVSLGTNIATGLAHPDSPLDEPVGADAKSCGYYPATGDIVMGGYVLDTLDPIDERKDIGIHLVFFGGHAYMIVAIEGSYGRTVDLGVATSWVAAQTLAGGIAGETSSYTRFGGGGVAFNHPRLTTPPI